MESKNYFASYVYKIKDEGECELFDAMSGSFYSVISFNNLIFIAMERAID